MKENPRDKAKTQPLLHPKGSNQQTLFSTSLGHLPLLDLWKQIHNQLPFPASVMSRIGLDIAAFGRVHIIGILWRQNQIESQDTILS